MKARLPNFRSFEVGRQFTEDLRPHKWQLGLVGLGSLLLIGFTLLKPWPIRWIFDEGLAPQGPVQHSVGFVVATGAGAAFLIAVLYAAAEYWRTVRLAAVGHQVTRSLRFRIFAHLSYLSPAFHAQHKSGDLLVRLMGDVPMVRTMIVDSFVELLTRLLLIVATLIAMLYLDPLLTVAVFVSLPLLAWVTRWFSNHLTIAVRKQRRKEGDLADFLHEAISASEVIQALGGEDHVVRRFAKSNRRTARAGLKATRIAAGISASVESLLGAGLALTLAVGSLRVAQAHLTPGELLMFLTYVRSLLKPVRAAARHAEKIAKGTACGERVLTILNQEPAVRSKPGAPVAPQHPRSLEFRDVYFSYDGRGDALVGVSFEVRIGQMVALVGASGAGKSTVAALAARLHDPDRGAVLLDGLPLTDWELTSLRKRQGLVMQEAVLFGESIRENLLLGRPEADEAELLRACRAAGAEAFLAELPEGLDTELGSQGTGLSGGQRRRISLARTLLRGSPILIVDEPFAGLDRAAAELVADTLTKLAEDRIVVIIAHDLGGLEDFDNVIFLQHGCVSAQGSHDELMRTQPRYRSVMRGAGKVLA